MLTSIDCVLIGIIRYLANLSLNRRNECDDGVFLLLLSLIATAYITIIPERKRAIIDFSLNRMICGTLFTFLLLFALRHEIKSLSEEIIPYVHVANNDRWMVLAHNRWEEFHFTRSRSQSPTVTVSLNYASLGTEIVQSLSMSQKPSDLQVVELVFIGGSRNSSERSFFHTKLLKDEKNQSLSIVHLNRTSITSLSSEGFESVVGIHPLGTHAVVVGDRGGYVYDMNTLSGYDWSAWDESTNEHYPKAVSFSRDYNIFVGANTQVKGAIEPTLYFAKFDPDGIQNRPLTFLEDTKYVEVKSIRTPMSMALRGALDGEDFAWIVGFPSLDFVLLYHRDNGSGVFVKTHRSVEKGTNFGQSVILTDDNTYGVLSSALSTAPWSTGRVQVCDVFFAVRGEKISRILASVSFNERQSIFYFSFIPCQLVEKIPLSIHLCFSSIRIISNTFRINLSQIPLRSTFSLCSVGKMVLAL